MTEPDKPRCSFCGKSQDDVAKLIAGPAVYICDECVDLSNDILMSEQGTTPWLLRSAFRSWKLSARVAWRALTWWMPR